MILSRGETERGVCILPIQVGVILGVVATSLMRKILKPYSWRLITLKEAYAMSGERAPSTSDFSSDGEEDDSYRRRSRTPHSESFSYDKDYHRECRNRNSSSRSLENDAMSKALNQISRSPFTHKIEGRRLPRQFTQPTFIMYNG